MRVLVTAAGFRTNDIRPHGVDGIHYIRKETLLDDETSSRLVKLVLWMANLDCSNRS
jgi:hypothetical protein